MATAYANTALRPGETIAPRTAPCAPVSPETLPCKTADAETTAVESTAAETAVTEAACVDAVRTETASAQTASVGAARTGTPIFQTARSDATRSVPSAAQTARSDSDLSETPSAQTACTDALGSEHATAKQKTKAADPPQESWASLHVLPSAYLEPWESGRVDDSVRFDAACHLDGQLLRIAALEIPCRILLSRLARTMTTRRSWQRLGFSRIGDYTSERLGLKARCVQEDVRVITALDELPQIRSALARGEIRWTSARIITRIATATDESFWLDRALTRTTRQLDAEVKEARKARLDGSAECEQRVTTADRGPAARSASQMDHRTGGPEIESPNLCREDPRCDDPASTKPYDKSPNGLTPDGTYRDGTYRDDTGPDSTGPNCNDPAPDDPHSAETTEETERVLWTLRCSRRGRRRWRQTRELAERMAGSRLTGEQVLELVCAEVSAFLPPEPPSADAAKARGVYREEVLASQRKPPPDFFSTTGWTTEQRIAAFESETGVSEGFTHALPPTLALAERLPAELAALAEGLDDGFGSDEFSGDGFKDGADSEIDGEGSCESEDDLDDRVPPNLRLHSPSLAPPDAFELDRRLRMVQRAIQSLDWQLGTVLRSLVDHRLYRDLGFANFKLYCDARLGIDSRKANQLVRLERSTWQHSPLLRDAYREGRISRLAALTILPVFSKRYAAAWIERASEVTLRRLNDEVSWSAERMDEGPYGRPVPPPPADLDVHRDLFGSLGADPASAGNEGATDTGAVGGSAFSAETSGNPAVDQGETDEEAARAAAAHDAAAHDETTHEGSMRTLLERERDPDLFGGARVTIEADIETIIFLEETLDRASRFLENRLRVSEERSPDRPTAEERETLATDPSTPTNSTNSTDPAGPAHLTPPGRRISRWQVFEWILEQAAAEWCAQPRHRDPVFERDGWRCRVPGCSARRELEDHHIVFRSHGGGNEVTNRIAVCHWHHHHAIHEGIVRASGPAPHGVRWQIGCRHRGADLFNGSPRADGRPLLKLFGERYQK